MSGKTCNPWEMARFEQIIDVEPGEHDVHEKEFHDQKPKHCFVVYFKDERPPWLMVAQNTHTRDLWVKGLKYLKSVSVTANEEKIARMAFEDADENGDQYLTFEEVLKLLHHMNIQPNRDTSLKLFQESRKSKIIIKNKDAINQEDFLTFYRAMHRRTDLETLYLTYTLGKAFLTPDNFYVFLRTAQQWHDVTLKDVQSIIQHSLHRDEIREVVNYEIFQEYMMSDNMQLFNQDHRRVYQDMSRPISEYYISTSHNTYLTGGQLKGVSDVQMFSHVLTSAGRCITIECVDGQNNTPLVTSAWTKTGSISFEKVIVCINNYAFRTSPYPVIISLTSKCSAEQRKVVANILRKTLMGKLWKPDKCEKRDIPSPLELKWKIIIHGHIEHNAVRDDLDSLVALPTVKFHEDEAMSNTFSFVLLEESKFFQRMKSSPEAINLITQTELVHLLPKTRRVSSSNIDPKEMWNEGVQAVAINWQTAGVPLMLNIGKFLDNGSSGYVLKPEILRSTAKYRKYKHDRQTTVVHISIEVISAHFLPKPLHDQKGEVIDPFVVVEVHGAPADKCKVRTKSVDNNGFNPTWYEKLRLKVHVPELAQVLFMIYDKDFITSDDFIGFYCLPFNSMRPGYRHMPLYDAYGNKMEKALLFVNVDLGEISKKLTADFRKQSVKIYQDKFNSKDDVKHTESNNTFISFDLTNAGSTESFKDL